VLFVYSYCNYSACLVLFYFYIFKSQMFLNSCRVSLMMEPTRKELGGCVVGYVKMVYSFFFFFFFFYMST
jgi:hypothetical protein